MKALRVEHKLLLCIARRSLDGSLKDHLRDLAQKEVNWDYLITVASQHGLLPLLCAQTIANCQDIVSPQVLGRLRSELLGNRQDVLYLLRELLRILNLFKAEGVRVLSFKGPVLAQIVYGDVGLRQAGDLDLLIAKQDFARAETALRSAGYAMEPQLTPNQLRSHFRSHCEIQFAHHDQFSVVDLHWGLTPKGFPFAVDIDELFSRSHSILVADHVIETFAGEDLLLYLCVHGAKHYWSRLEWVAAVAELVRGNTGFDWSLIVTRAKESKNEKILCLGLLLAGDLFAFDLPSEVSEILERHEALRECALEMRQKLFSDVSKPTQIEIFRMNAQLMDHKRDAVLGLLRSVLVPTISDWQTLTLPGLLHPLYYGFRPIRLLNKYARRREDE